MSSNIVNLIIVNRYLIIIKEQSRFDIKSQATKPNIFTTSNNLTNLKRISSNGSDNNHFNYITF